MSATGNCSDVAGNVGCVAWEKLNIPKAVCASVIDKDSDFTEGRLHLETGTSTSRVLLQVVEVRQRQLHRVFGNNCTTAKCDDFFISFL